MCCEQEDRLAGRRRINCLLWSCEHRLQEAVSFSTAVAWPLTAVSEHRWHTRYIALVKLKHFGSVQLSLNVLVVLCLPVLCLKGPWLRKGAETVILIHMALSHTLFLKTIGCSSRWIALVALAQFWVVSFLKATVCRGTWVLTEGWSSNSAVEEVAESKQSLVKLHLSVTLV